MSLDSHAEVSKLAHELQADPGSLDGLATLEPADLRRLRAMTGDALHDAHRAAFQRAASASALLPTGLTAKLAQTIIGPYLAARIAAEMPAERSVKLASHLDVAFLADVCLSLDPARVASTVQGLPDDRVVEVGMALLERGEYVTLGKFVDVVEPAVLDTMSSRIEDPAALLAIATSIEAHHRLDELMARIDDRRLAGMADVAVDEDRVAAMLTLMTHLGPDNRRRVAGVAAEAGPGVIDGVVRTAHAEDAWGDLLPLLGEMDDEHLPMVVNVPATADPDVLAAVVEAADRHDLWGALLPIAAHLDDDRVQALAEHEDLLTPERVHRLVVETRDRPDLAPGLARTLARVPVDRQHELAERLVAAGEVDVDMVLALVDLAPEAADLPVVVALNDRRG